MTFCLGMKCEEGLLAIADTRVTSGREMSIAKSMSVHQTEKHSMFILTSGLRSLRDKAVTYFEERLASEDGNLGKMFQAANALSAEIRRVRAEEQEWLAEGGLRFDLRCILGGELEADSEHRLYLLYPEGNWEEVRVGTPYVIIGESRYGKPLLDRLWRHDLSLADPLSAGLISFDATRTSASNVDLPVDCVLYRRGTFQMHEQRFDADALEPIGECWSEAIVKAVESAKPLVDSLFETMQTPGRSERR